jgi:hypothetical protein
MKDSATKQLSAWLTERVAVVGHAHVRYVVGIVRGRLDHERVDGILDHGREHARGDRRARERQAPGHGLAVRAQRGRNLVEGRRAVGVVRGVVLARPQQLHRLAHGLARLDGRRDEVHLQPAAEAAAQERGVHAHLLGFEPRRGGGRRLRDDLDLRRDVQIAALGRDRRRAVLWLERRVREQRQLVIRMDDLAAPAADRRQGVAVVARDLTAVLRGGGGRPETFADVRVVQLRVRAVVPGDDERIARLARAPPAVGHDHDTARGLHDVLHARQGLRPRGVEAAHRAAQHRRLRQRAVQHAVQPDVDAVARAAVHLPWRVETRLALADDGEVAARLELHVLRHRQLAGRLGNLAEAQPLAPRRHDGAALGTAAVHRDAQPRACGGHEHLARLRARGAQLHPGVAHARAATGDLRAQEVVRELRARRGEFHVDIARRDAQLLRHQHGQRGVYPLTHLGAVAIEAHGAIGADLEPGVQVHGRRGTRGRRGRLATAGRQADGEHEPARRQQRALEEPAPVERGVHARSFVASSAARWMPARIR